MPTGVLNGTGHSLLHFHVCIHCTSRFRREEIEERAQTTGLLVCPECGKEGPLNIEILGMSGEESERITAR